MTTQTPAETSQPKTADMSNSSTPSAAPQMDGMTMRLKNSIEREGQFNDALNDMAEGYAAGRGMPFFDAKNEIKDRFYQQMNMSPKAYLDQNYNQRPNYAQNSGNNAPARSPSQSNGRGR